MRAAAAIIALAALAPLPGCDWSQRMEHKLAPDTLSLADRCAGVMTAAMPYAQFEIGDRSSQAQSVRTIVARASATRTDLAKDSPGERDFAVECTYTDNVLTAFHWTKGGPAPDEAPNPAGSR